MTTLTLSYRLALAGFVAQFILLGWGTFAQADAQTGSVYQIIIGLLWTLIKGLPWLVLVPGLLLKSKNVLAWMSYVCLLYLIIWILAAFSVQGQFIAIIGVIITVIQFTAAGLYTRLIKRQVPAELD